jgi:GNAT superfamily N-acetyltransferase
VIEAARPAVAEDLPTLLALYRAGAGEMAHLSPAWAALDGRADPAEESLEAALSDDATEVFLGTIDGVPVGYAVVCLQPRKDVADGHVWIQDIYVEPDARGIGVGEELINSTLGWGRQRGARSAEIRVLPSHRDAKNFCEENGFSAHVLALHKDLPPASG